MKFLHLHAIFTLLWFGGLATVEGNVFDKEGDSKGGPPVDESGESAGAAAGAIAESHAASTISTRRDCYELDQFISVDWDYAHPRDADWLGMYPVS